MHSTIFVLNDNPISQNDVIDYDYFSVSQIERRGYDYCGVTNLEYEAEDYFSGYYSDFFQTEIMKTEYEDYPEDNFVQYKMGITEILYLHYEVDKPLIPQVKENGKLAGKMLAMVEDMVSRVQCG